MNAGTVFLFLLGIMRGLSFPTGCAVDEWQCSNGACIQLTSKCDNFPDCSDGSDEQKCTVAPVCLEGLESCPQPNGTTICVEKAVGCGCGLAPDIAHGVISSNSNTIGSSANVTCDAGYETATESILCQDTGIWETAFCSPKDCGPVEKIQYGTIYLSDINNTTFGASGSVVCDEGYETLTLITTCRKNGKWDSVICTRIDCGPPPAISFGNITLDNDNNSTFGAIARVTCVDNYAANTSTVTCKASGEWEQASCTSTGCGPASKILHGTITSKDKSSSGSSANVTCDPGYKANISTVTCKSSGEWESAKCSAIDCGSVPVIVFGKITLVDLNNATYGASANITCDTGYTANVSAVSCRSSGVWETAICKAIDCGPVPEISFGTTKLIDEYNTTYGASAYLTCDTGFETNVSNITCQSSGLWETAVCKAKDCGPVPVVPFGRVSLIDNGNTTYGASANVTCETGFETSDLKIKCQSSGIWQTVICKSIDCGPVPAIAFGTTKLIDENNTTYGASAYLTCDTGFETNILNITCQSSGLWETAVCKAKDCGPVPVVPFGRVSLIDNGNTTYGASANVTCETGFEKSDLKIKCQSSGVWQTVICKSTDCGPVPEIAFGTFNLNDNNNTTYGASAHLTCDAGFETNILNITCQSSGLWETAVCKAKDCGPVPEIAFGTTTLIDDNNTTYGASAYLTCDTGFETNVSNVMCQNSGLWETAVCKAKNCGPVPVVPFGRVSLIDNGNTTYGASANVTCETGFETNDLKIKCQRSGIWQTALCKAIDCGSPPTISFGNISLNADNNSTVGATAFVNCNENYVASRPKITCQSTGVWENVTCFSKGCSSIPTISNGKITVTGTTSVGSFANVTCDVGYEASVSSIKCQISRIWETAECKIKACGRVPAIKHGKVNLIDSFHTSVGDSANVVCDTGYETSKTKVACQSSGVWETALCTAKDCGPPPVISNGNITLSNDKMSTYGAEALVNCNDKYVANVSKIKCQSSGLWEVAQCAPEGQLNYDRCTEEHGVCTQHIYENIRLLALKSSKCRSFCHCAHAGTLIDGSVTYKWVERNCPQGTLFDDNLPSPVCNHPYMVWC